jgi:hypothetical protein
MTAPKRLVDRLLSHVEKTPTCWLWRGTTGQDGYGRIVVDRRLRGAHRISYEVLVGPVPEGLHLDHLCRVRNCVNPEHLEPVTCRENLLRGETRAAANAAKTHCPKGHPYNEENTMFDVKRKLRSCRECSRRRAREWKARRRAAATEGNAS